MGQPIGMTQASGLMVDETGAILTVQRVFINATSGGITPIVVAQGVNKSIRVLQYCVVCPAPIIVTFQGGLTAISAGKPFSANGGQDSAYNPHGHFQTAANAALNVSLSALVAPPGVGIELTYIVITVP